jgi:aminoglycoside phosphotransferase (APT) family kinase protein
MGPSNDNRESERTDATTARLVLAEANATLGNGFRLERPLKGGFQAGAWLIRDPDDGPAVLKWSPDPALGPRNERAAEAAHRATAAGYPTPAWLAVGVTESGLPYHIQEFAQGRPATRLTADVAGQLVVVLERQRGLDVDPGRSWSRYTREQLSGGWDPLLQAVGDSGPAGRRFVAVSEALIRTAGEIGLPTDDLVHGDFRLGNVLFLSGQITAVIDVEALGSGTRAYDYGTLMTVDDIEPAGWDLIRAAGERVAGPGVLAQCFALASMELAHFVLRHVPDRLPAIIGPLTERAAALLP